MHVGFSSTSATLGAMTTKSRDEVDEEYFCGTTSITIVDKNTVKSITILVEGMMVVTTSKGYEINKQQGSTFIHDLLHQK